MGKENRGDPELHGEGPLKKSLREFIYHGVRPKRWHRTGATGEILWRPDDDDCTLKGYQTSSCF